VTSLLVAIALAPAAYQFAPSQANTFTMKAEFDGFVPVLGGNEGKVEVVLGIAVTGLEPKGASPRASYDINRFELKFNEAPLPFGIEMVKDFFPKSEVTATPQGRVTANTAPNRGLPVRLPGLDPRRLPDLTFLPIELPEEGLEEGKTWQFERVFDGAPMKYTCKVETLNPAQAEISVEVSQQFEYLENEALEAVTKEADAISRAKASLTGRGKIWFSLESGAALGTQMRSESTTTVTPIKGGKESVRKLISRLEVTRGSFAIPASLAPSAAKPSSGGTAQTPPARTPGKASPGRGAPAKTNPGMDLGAWGAMAWDAGVSFLEGAKRWGTSVQALLSFALVQIPLVGPILANLLGGK
jgi:hypothetical protein